MVPFYERGGFRQFTRHRRFEFTSTDTAPDLDPGLTQLSNIDFQDIEDMDAVCFPGSRGDFLKSWIEQDDAISLGLVEKDRLRGYGLMRPCLSGWKVGPLIADEIETANRLWTGFSKHGQGKSIFIDSPDNNPSAIHLCKSDLRQGTSRLSTVSVTTTSETTGSVLAQPAIVKMTEKMRLKTHKLDLAIQMDSLRCSDISKDISKDEYPTDSIGNATEDTKNF